MSSKPLDCAACGCEAELVGTEPGLGYVRCMSPSCGLEGPLGEPDDVVARWNARPAIAKLEERLAQSVDELSLRCDQLQTAEKREDELRRALDDLIEAAGASRRGCYLHDASTAAFQACTEADRVAHASDDGAGCDDCELWLSLGRANAVLRPAPRTEVRDDGD